MSEKTYRIILQGSGTGTNEIDQTPEEKEKKKSQGLIDPAIALQRRQLSDMEKAVAVKLGSTAVNYAISNYGDLTGNYQRQEAIQTAIQLGTMGALLATGPLGWAAVGASVATQGISQYVDLQKREQQRQFLIERVGLANQRSK